VGSEDMPTPCLAVVMPCYNEASTVERVIERVLASPYTAELIVVNDGSTDGSAEIVEKIGDARVRVINQQINLGKGAALRRGFAAVTSPFVIVQDADLEYDPDDYGVVLGPLLDGRADVVYGSRFAPKPHRVLYYSHAVGNRLLTFLSNMVTNLNFTDVVTGSKAFRREVLDSIELEQDRFGFELEITAKIAGGTWRVYEVGISYAGRTYEEGKKAGWTDSVRWLYCIFRYSGFARRWTHPRDQAALLSPPLLVDEADVELATTLDNLEDASNYADWIIELMAPHVAGEIVEIGAGHGTMSGRLARLGHVTATEPAARAAAILEARFAGDHRVDVRRGDAGTVMTGQCFDAAVMVNVLEHVPDDVGALNQIREGLRPGGTIAVFVPAHEFLYSSFDHRIGHHRRYRRSSLAQTIATAGFEIVEINYVNMPGILAWLLVARFLNRTPTQARLASVYDRFIVPVVRRVERAIAQRSHVPFGLSLLAIAKRPEEPTGPST